MNYTEIKKLDEESARKMKEGSGPVDECICHLLSPPDGERKSIGASIKKAIASITPGMPGKKRTERGGLPSRKRTERGGMPSRKRTGGAGLPGKNRISVVGPGGVDVPVVFTKGEQGMYSTKEVVKHKGSCGKCGCDKENIVMKHSFANIRITSPDVSSICPCPTSCLPEKANLAMNNIKVTVERVIIDPDRENSKTSLHHHRQQKVLKEPVMTDRKSVTSLINAQYVTDEDKLYD